MAYLVKNGAILTISGDPIVAPTSGDSSVNNKPVQTVTPTESQQIISYSSPYTGLEGVIVTAISSTYVGSGITNRTSSDLTASGATVSVPAGYYEEAVSKSVTTMTLPTSAAASSTSGYTSKATISRSTSDQYINIPPGYNAAGGYYKISAVANGSATNSGSISGSSATVSTGTNTLTLTKSIEITPNVTAGYISSGTAGSVSVALTANVTTKAAATYTPTTTSQTIAANTYLTGIQTIAAIPSQYIVPSGTKSITTNGTGIDVTQYAAVDVAVPTGSTINNKPSQTVTPTESQQTIGYNSPYTGLEEVIVDAIDSWYIGSNIPQYNNSDIIINGNNISGPSGGYWDEGFDISVSTMTLPTAASSNATSGYTSKATISRSTSDQYINIPPGYNSAGGYYKISAVANGSVTAPATISGTSATLSTGTGTLTLTKTVSVTPSVTTAGYISSGTAGNSEISLTASVTINPTPTASGATVTIPAGYYSSQTTKSVSTMTLPTAASATSSGTSKATISRSTSNQYINIPVGYNDTAAYYTISAVANGSATGPTSITQSSATVSTGTNTLTLTKQNVTTTPTVSAGYVSSATASTATVSLTASVTTKAAATYYPSTSDQTISASQYLTGSQTIKAVVVSGLDASKILSGTTVKVGDSVDDDRITAVSGSVSFVTYYTGSSAPSSSLGSNGDIYLQS